MSARNLQIVFYNNVICGITPNGRRELVEREDAASQWAACKLDNPATCKPICIVHDYLPETSCIWF